MASTRRFLFLFLSLGFVVLGTRPVAAARGIYCTSYDYIASSREMTCRVVCIYCYDLDTQSDASESCYESACWFRQY